MARKLGGLVRENNFHKIQHGTLEQGEAHSRCKFSDAAALQIIREFNAGARLCDIARKHGVSGTHTRQIVRGISRKYLVEKIGDGA